MKAITVLTLQGEIYRREPIDAHLATTQCAVEAAKKKVLATLHRYVKKNEVDHIYYKDIYYWFDFDEFKRDLEKFGVDVPESQIVPIGMAEK